jgi:hypothetical protein
MMGKKTKAKFQVGDRVRTPHSIYPFLRGTVLEDCGLRYDGLRHYVVGIDSDPFEPDPHTFPEDRLEPDVTPPAPLEKSEILRYLKNGGLLGVLMTNPSPEGPKYPHVYLCRDQLGNVTYTFAAERGMVGGAPVPFAAFWGTDGIHAHKGDEVAAYLLTFGLTPEEADDVIRAVGVAPVKKPRRRKAETA